jgi:hypothetical protein
MSHVFDSENVSSPAKLICGALEKSELHGTSGNVTTYELPLSYADGDPLKLEYIRDGKKWSITDGGRTFLRLLSEGQEKSLHDWAAKKAYFSRHAMRLQGHHFEFAGTTESDFLQFVQGIQKIEATLPKKRSISKHFDYIIRSAVTERLEQIARRKQIPKGSIKKMVSPLLSIDHIHQKKSIQIPIKPDFMSLDGSRLFITISFQNAPESERLKHIRAKLAVLALDGAENWESYAITEDGHELSTRELDLIRAFTHNGPLQVTKETAGQRIGSILVENPKGPLTNFM